MPKTCWVASIKRREMKGGSNTMREVRLYCFPRPVDDWRERRETGRGLIDWLVSSSAQQQECWYHHSLVILWLACQPHYRLICTIIIIHQLGFVAAFTYFITRRLQVEQRPDSQTVSHTSYYGLIDALNYRMIIPEWIYNDHWQQ
jgi:hypothetical protein